MTVTAGGRALGFDVVTGSPWWVDSLHVEHGDTHGVAFVADNPGIGWITATISGNEPE